MNCPWCRHPITDTRILSEAGMIAVSRRTKVGGGRKRSADRCPCGRYALRTSAKLQYHKCVAPTKDNEDDPSDTLP